MLRRLLSYGVMVGIISGCLRNAPPGPTGEPPLGVSTSKPVFSITPWTDVSEVMYGICFEAALEFAGQVFVLRSEADLIRFYNQVDDSHLCRQPVQRNLFDFNTGRLLVGTWSAGRGCTASHEVLGIARDDNTRELVVYAHFETAGTCDYELVRPFWITLDDVADYKISLVVE